MSYGGLSAKERLAQLQQKSGLKDTPPAKLTPLKKVGKLNGAGDKPAEEKKPLVELKKTGSAEKKVEDKKPEVKKLEEKKPEEKKAEEKKPADGPKEAAKEAAKPEAKKEEPKKPEVKEVEKPKEEAKEPPKPAEAAKKEPEKPKEEAKKPEPAKPKEEPKTPVEPPKAEAKDKPKEEVKVPAAKEPAKPAEEPKKAPEPAKPKEPEAKPAPKPAEVKEVPKAAEPAKTESAKSAETKPAVKPKEESKAPAPAAVKEPEKPKEEAKKPEPVKPKDEPAKTAPQPKPEEKKPEEKKPAPAAAAPKPAVAAEPAKPAAAAASAAQPAKQPEAKPAEKPKEEPKKEVAAAPAPAAAPPKISKAATDAMIGTIFYFSGMGSLLGSALAEGVYVPERSQRSALDVETVEAARVQAKKREEIVVTARNQAQGLSTDFRHLQALLESVPTFGEPIDVKPMDRRAVDEPIHGHVYFQQQQRVQQQQPQLQLVEVKHFPTPDATDGIVLQPPPTRDARRTPSGLHEAPVNASFTSTVHHTPPPAAAQIVLPGQYAGYGNEADGGRPQYQPQQPRQLHPQPPQQTITSSQAWQDRYGPGDASQQDTSRSPRPFASTDHGNIDATGIKSWQLSKIRTAEAKGYRLVSDNEILEQEPRSFAPYAVPERATPSQKPFQQYGGGSQEVSGVASQPFRPQSTGGASGAGASYPFASSTPVNSYPFAPSPAGGYPFAPAVENSLPYCDL